MERLGKRSRKFWLALLAAGVLAVPGNVHAAEPGTGQEMTPKETKYQITYETGGGTLLDGVTSPATVTAGADGNAAVTLPNAQSSGKVLKGWKNGIYRGKRLNNI